MKLVAQTSQFRVYDDVLSERDFRALWPNRLVVIAGGTCHRISPVTSSAGDHVRCTVAGFFHRPLT